MTKKIKTFLNRFERDIFQTELVASIIYGKEMVAAVAVAVVAAVQIL